MINLYNAVNFLLATTCVTLRDCASTTPIIYKSAHFVRVYGRREQAYVWGPLHGTFFVAYSMKRYSMKCTFPVGILWFVPKSVYRV